jgi:hypothetical protein
VVSSSAFRASSATAAASAGDLLLLFDGRFGGGVVGLDGGDDVSRRLHGVGLLVLGFDGGELRGQGAELLLGDHGTGLGAGDRVTLGRECLADELLVLVLLLLEGGGAGVDSLAAADAEQLAELGREDGAGDDTGDGEEDDDGQRWTW